MDFYPTRYNELSNFEVNALYRSDMWSNLSREEKLEALQELENRTAEELGNHPCEVCTEKMNGAMYGYYSSGQIVVNESLINDGVLRYEDSDGNTLEFAPDDVNAQMMDTIHHENYHAYQADVINNRLEHNNQSEVNLWRANEEVYISSCDNDVLYRIQPQERVAFERGESQTKAAFNEIEDRYGEDAGYQEYIASINKYSYDNALTMAKETYGDENIQETVDNYMLASYDDIHTEDSENAIAAVSSENDEAASDGDVM